MEPGSSSETDQPGETIQDVEPVAPKVHFDTPAWVPAPRNPLDQPTAQIPQQPVPQHDYAPRPPVDPGVITEGRWVGRTPGRWVLTLALVVALAATALLAIFTLPDATTSDLVTLAIPAAIAVGLWCWLLGTAPSVLTLDHSIMQFRGRGSRERFDLHEPQLMIEVVENVDDPKWQATLDRGQGNRVTLTRRNVPQSAITPLLLHHIERQRRSRARRR
jgi:hypothetical protein